MKDTMGDNPVIRYVNMLLTDMVARDLPSVTLRPTECPPILEHSKSSGPKDPPEFQKLVNRLKIMSGLNPVQSPTPISGSFDLSLGDNSFTVTIHFEDKTEDPFCTIELERKGSQQ